MALGLRFARGLLVFCFWFLLGLLMFCCLRVVSLFPSCVPSCPFFFPCVPVFPAFPFFCALPFPMPRENDLGSILLFLLLLCCWFVVHPSGAFRFGLALTGFVFWIKIEPS